VCGKFSQIFLEQIPVFFVVGVEYDLHVGWGPDVVNLEDHLDELGG
jgi:hypothetical protein